MCQSSDPAIEAEDFLLLLTRRYPEQFAAPHLDFQPMQGWIPLFARLCAAVSQVPENAGGDIQWLQVKEKVGSMRARYRVAPGVDETRAHVLRNKVSDLCEQFRAASENTCQICSMPAPRAVHQTDAVLCDFHRAKKIGDPEKFAIDEDVRLHEEATQIASWREIRAQGEAC
jgi:hypothetical protein